MQLQRASMNVLKNLSQTERGVAVIVKSLVWFLLLAVMYPVQAQNKPVIRGVVVDSVKKEKISSVNILVYKQDSVFVAHTVSDKDGTFVLKGLADGEYTLHLSHIQYNDRLSPCTVRYGTSSVDTLYLSSRNYVLDDLVVEPRWIRRQADRYKVSMKNNPIAQGVNIKDALGRLPGVSSRNGLSINGVSGTTVYVNGRKLSGENELDAIPANMVKNVEVIFVAGSAHDAQSRGGVILITLEDPDNKGGYGIIANELSIRPRYGFGGENVNSVVNYKYAKWNVYNYINYDYFKTLSDYAIDSYYPESLSRIDMRTQGRGRVHGLRENLGIVYEITPQHNIGVNFNMGLTRSNSKESSVSYLSGDNINAPSGTSSGLNTPRGRNNLYQVTLNYLWKINDDGATLNVNSDYLNTLNTSDAYRTYYYDYDEELPYSVWNKDHFQDRIHMFDNRIDVSIPIREKHQLRFGARYYLNRTHRIAQYDSLHNEVWVNDANLSDRFTLQGDGYAVYTSFSSSIHRFAYSLGLRAQWDRIGYSSRIGHEDTERRYMHLFPTVSLSYTFDDDETILTNLSYTRGIQYMPFSEISSTVKFLSEYSYTRGNPDLIPAYYNAVQFSVTIKKWDIYYNYESIPNMIHYMTFIDDENPLVKYSMPMNSSSIIGHIAGITREFDIAKWWNLSTDLMLRNRKTQYEESGTTKAYRSTAYFADITNYFTFSNTFGGEINFYGETAEKIDDKTVFPVYSIGAKVYKYILKKKFLLKLSANQIVSKLRNNRIDKDIYQSRSRFLTNQTALVFSIQYNFRSAKDVRVKRIQKIQAVQKQEEKE